jgi:hypothetical protein
MSTFFSSSTSPCRVLALVLSLSCLGGLLTGCSDDQMATLTANKDGSYSLSAADQAAALEQGYDVPTLHMAQLQWQAPSQRVGGTPQPIAEIKSYFVYYFMQGSEEEASQQPIKVNVGNRTRVGMPLDVPGTYYFAVSTLDNQKRESAPSEFIAVNVP